jgi:periplasmic protein CpxP/Spy
MKLKFKLLIAFILLATTGVYSQGFQRQTVPERVKTTMEKLQPLQLNPTQMQQTDSVFTDFYTSQNKMREDARASGTRPDRSIFEKMSSDRDEKLKTIFTADQFTKFKNEIEATLRPQRPAANN